MTEQAPYRVDWHASHERQEGALPERYRVRLRDGSGLELPLRPLPGGEMAIALLMSNQTSFVVEERICERLADLAKTLNVDAIVGIPTMGLTYARSVASRLGFPDYVAMGQSRKFWYEDALSQPVVSSTSPDVAKRLYLDPALQSRVRGRRVVLIDDVLNTGQTAAAASRLLHYAQAELCGIVAVLTEGWLWQDELAHVDQALPQRVHALGHIPMFRRAADGWEPDPETDLDAGRDRRTKAVPD